MVQGVGQPGGQPLGARRARRGIRGVAGGRAEQVQVVQHHQGWPAAHRFRKQLLQYLQGVRWRGVGGQGSGGEGWPTGVKQGVACEEFLEALARHACACGPQRQACCSRHQALVQGSVQGLHGLYGVCLRVAQGLLSTCACCGPGYSLTPRRSQFKSSRGRPPDVLKRSSSSQ